MTLLEQLQKLEQQKKDLLGGILNEIQEKVDQLNSAGFNYKLVEETGTTDISTGRRTRRAESKPRQTTEEAFVNKIHGAFNRRMKDLPDSKKKSQWTKEEPLVRKFYADNYRDGQNVTGIKYRPPVAA